MRFGFLCAIAALLLLGACRKDARPDVGMGMILPPAAPTMKIPENQAFLMAAPVSEPLPVFPPELVASAREPVHACATFVVNADGSVGDVQPLYDVPECPLPAAELDPRYTAAVLDAVRQWEFFAAAVCTFPPGVPKNHECEGDGVVVAPVAIRMAFVFSFEVERGRAVVRQRSR